MGSGLRRNDVLSSGAERLAPTAEQHVTASSNFYSIKRRKIANM
jgi:hypothetical protein